MKHAHVARAVLACLLIAALACAQTAERIGLEETFDNVEGWQRIDFPGEEAPLKEMKSVDGVALFVTHPAPLGSQKGDTRWHDGLTPYDPFSNIAKNYPELDLDKYRYLVMKIDEKATPSSVIVNHVDLPVAYTTGIRAVDLSLYEDLRGRQPIEFRIQFLNTGTWTKIDMFRFVSELTDDEKKGLIPPGIVLGAEGLEHNPTQGLDAVMQRAGRPRMESLPAEKLCFRDTATGAVIWRMTGLQSGSSIVSDSARGIFNKSGSHMLFPFRKGGPQLYDFQTGEFRLNPYAGISRFSPTDPDILWCVEKTRQPTGIRFHKLNVSTGMDEIAGQVTYDPKSAGIGVTDLGFALNTDQIAVGLRGTPYVFLFDPAVPEVSRRVRTIELPMRLKGMGLSPDGKRLFWHRCYWYEGWEMDLATGETKRRVNFGGSHAGRGGGLRLGHHQGLIIAAPEGLGDPSPGDDIKILLNYRSGWHSDYGHLSDDRQWYICNGTGGDMQNKVIMSKPNEPGTVLQVALQNTSRDNWGNNTVIRSSRDYTKLTWVCNIWGYDAVCMAYTRRPEATYRFYGEREADAVGLRWEAPRTGNRLASETAGYNLYRSVDGGPFLALNDELVRSTTYRDEDLDPAKLYSYVVCGQEHCGLEGVPSDEFLALPPGKANMAVTPYKLHVEAEHGVYVTPPARQVFNGWASAWRYVRVRRLVESEDVGTVQNDMTPQLSGAYTLWLRVRTEGTPGTWSVGLDREALGEVNVAEDAWTWVRLQTPVALEAGKRCRVILRSGDDGLCVDKLILAHDPAYVPETMDDRFTTQPGKLEHLVAQKVTPSSVRIAWWDPIADPGLDYYNVYVGRNPGFATDQAHLVGSTRRTEFLDWGLAPGTDYTYKVVVVNRRGVASEPAELTVTTTPVSERVLLELPMDGAKLDPRLKKETKAGVRYAFRPYGGEGHDKDPAADITWEFDLPVAGEYMIWCRYAPADVYRTNLRIPVLLDDVLDGKAVWQMRTPYRGMRGPTYRNWKEDLWFVDKVSMYVWPRPRELFKLSAGKHKLTLRVSPKIREFHHKISAVWITNDPSFRPEGWDPQADFKKAKLQRR